MSSTDTSAPDQQCTFCKKPQSDLPTALKTCAKCHTQSYCSRECQKNDWKNHKKTCAQNSATTTSAPAAGAGSHASTKPEVILKHAQQTVDLLTALSHDPNFRKDLRSIPQSAAGLMYLSDFVSRTFREYWAPLLPPQVFATLSGDLESFHGIERDQHLQDMAAKFEEVKAGDATFDKDEWPRLDREKYSDCVRRNLMAAEIVQSPGKQGMMGGVYDYPEEVKEACKKITSG